MDLDLPALEMLTGGRIEDLDMMSHKLSRCLSWLIPDDRGCLVAVRGMGSNYAEARMRLVQSLVAARWLTVRSSGAVSESIAIPPTLKVGPLPPYASSRLA